MKLGKEQKNYNNLKIKLMVVDPKFLDYFKNLKQVFLYITDECNLKCEQCLYKPNLTQKLKIKPETAKNLLKIARDLGAFKLSILGGELTLYNTSDLIDVLKYSKEVLGFTYIRVVTNGIFKKSLFQTGLFDYIDEISFSIDGYDAETHEALRGQNSFNTTINNLRYAVQSDRMVHITACVTKQNTTIAGGVENMLARTIKFAEREGAHTINFHGVFEMGTPMDAWTNESHLTPKEYYEGVKKIHERMSNNEFNINIRLPLHIVKREEFEANIDYFGSYCPSKLGERILIHPTGIIRICSSLLSSNLGVANFNDEKIVWNFFNNELKKVDCTQKTPCSQQTAMYSREFVPVCFSFKPHQEEVVWKQLKEDGLGISLEDSQRQMNSDPDKILIDMV